MRPRGQDKSDMLTASRKTPDTIERIFIRKLHHIDASLALNHRYSYADQRSDRLCWPSDGAPRVSILGFVTVRRREHAKLASDLSRERLYQVRFEFEDPLRRRRKWSWRNGQGRL